MCRGSSALFGLVSVPRALTRRHTELPQPLLAPARRQVGLCAPQDGSSSSPLCSEARRGRSSKEHGDEPQLPLSATRNALTAPCCHGRSGPASSRKQSASERQKQGAAAQRSDLSTFIPSRTQQFIGQEASATASSDEDPAPNTSLPCSCSVFPRCRSSPAAQPSGTPTRTQRNPTSDAPSSVPALQTGKASIRAVLRALHLHVSLRLCASLLTALTRNHCSRSPGRVRPCQAAAG